MTNLIGAAASMAPRKRVLAMALCLSVAGVWACHRTVEKSADSAQPAAKQAPGGANEGAEGVTLTAEQAEKMGIATEAAKPAEYTAETAGYGIVVPHDTIATAVAELSTAQAAVRQSRAALDRARRLTGTPGAMSADAVESAARQTATDDAALSLAERRLSSVVGTGPRGGLSRNDSVLQELANGKVKLLRATFPLGALGGSPPVSLRAAHLDAVSPDMAHPSQGWSLNAVWAAPADASLPGRSYFALLKGSDAGEGERLLVWAPGDGPSQSGATIPAAALVISEGKYWCYVETRPDAYVRRPVDTSRPVTGGYFVSQGILAGDKVVTAAAGLLLARETNPSTEAD